MHREDVVLAAELHKLGDVEADGGDAVLIFADELSVEEETPGLPHAIELDKDLLAVGAGGQLEMFAIPADAKHLFALVAAAVADVGAIGVRLVPCVRQADPGPRRVVERRLIGAGASPKANFQPGLKL